MAATVLAGTGNVSYTNNTGGNVRVIVNYFGANSADGTTNGKGISMNIAGATISAQYTKAIGKNLALQGGYARDSTSSISLYAQNLATDLNAVNYQQALPIEFYLATTQSMSITLSGGTASYNVLVIPEAG